MGKATGNKNNAYRLSEINHDSNSFRILLAEDDKEMRSLLALMLRKEGYQVCECMDGLSLLDMLSSFFLPDEEHENFDLIISDIRMPGVTGMEILMIFHPLSLSRHSEIKKPMCRLNGWGPWRCLTNLSI